MWSFKSLFDGVGHVLRACARKIRNVVAAIFAGWAWFTGASKSNKTDEYHNIKKLKLSPFSDISLQLGNIISLNRLEELDVSFTNLTHAYLEKIILKAPNLKKLKFRGCYKLNELAGNIGSLGCLEELDVSFSAITRINLAEMIRNAPKLKKLNLSECYNIYPLLDNIVLLNSLEELNLSMSSLTYDDLAKIIAKAPNLKKLNLMMCYKIYPLPDNMVSLNSLEELDVSYMKLTGADFAKIIAKAPNLKKINLSHCRNISLQLGNIISLNSLEELEELDVSDMNLTGADFAKIIAKAPNLKKLNLSHCKNIFPLPDDIVSLHNLKQLNIIGMCDLTDADFAKIIAMAPNLNNISLNLDLVENAPSWLKCIFAVQHDIGPDVMKDTMKEEYALMWLSKNVAFGGRPEEIMPTNVMIHHLMPDDLSEQLKDTYFAWWNKVAANICGYGDVSFSWIMKGLSKNKAFAKAAAVFLPIFAQCAKDRKYRYDIAKAAFLPIFAQCAKRRYDVVKTPAARGVLYQKARDLNVVWLEDRAVLRTVFNRVLNG